MKILWLATDRSNRVAKIFDPLREEVSKIVSVDTVLKKLPTIAGQYIKMIKGGLSEPSVINVKKASEYDLVMVDAPFAFTQEKWRRIRTKKAVLFEDQHGFNLELTKMFKNFNFDCFFTRYNNILLRHSHLSNSKVMWLPHSIDENIIKDYKMKKDIDALMVGTIQKINYPIRYNINKELSNEKWYKRIKRPVETFNEEKKWPVGKDYAKLLNSSWICFSCLSVFKYPVLKFFEIPGCKSALFSDYDPQLKKLGFIRNKSMVDLEGKLGNLKNNIEKYLKDKNKLIDISNAGYELVHTKHTSKKRAEDFLNKVDKI